MVVISGETGPNMSFLERTRVNKNEFTAAVFVITYFITQRSPTDSLLGIVWFRYNMLGTRQLFGIRSSECADRSSTDRKPGETRVSFRIREP